jgi:hypothetical protein
LIETRRNGDLALKAIEARHPTRPGRHRASRVLLWLGAEHHKTLTSISLIGLGAVAFADGLPGRLGQGSACPGYTHGRDANQRCRRMIGAHPLPTGPRTQTVPGGWPDRSGSASCDVLRPVRGQPQPRPKVTRRKPWAIAQAGRA